MSNFDAKLIAATKKREILYCQSHKSRKYAYVKNQAWKEVSLEIGAPIKACKARWTSLRDRFRTIVKAEEEELRKGREFHCKWKWYKPLSFLSNDYVQNTCNNDDDGFAEQEIGSVLSVEHFHEGDSEHSFERGHNNDEADPIGDSSYEAAPKMVRSVKTDPYADISPSPAKMYKLESNATNEFNVTKLRIEPTHTSSNSENTATYTFFMSLADRIKTARLPLLKQMKLEADILNFTIKQLEEIHGNAS